MTQIYKHYHVTCSENGHVDKVGIWCNDDGDLQEIPVCTICGSSNTVTEENHTSKKNTGPATIRPDWRKKIPSDYKNFIETSFKKRHGSGSNFNV